jgi:hypothetical protein
MAKATGTSEEIDWKARAWRRWRRAYWIEGDGPVALLAHCGVLTVTLHDSVADAEDDRIIKDGGPCGSRCKGDHEIVDMRNRRKR